MLVYPNRFHLKAGTAYYYVSSCLYLSMFNCKVILYYHWHFPFPAPSPHFSLSIRKSSTSPFGNTLICKRFSKLIANYVKIIIIILNVFGKDNFHLTKASPGGHQSMVLITSCRTLGKFFVWCSILSSVKTDFNGAWCIGNPS